jgi:hypothetical protein
MSRARSPLLRPPCPQVSNLPSESNVMAAALALLLPQQSGSDVVGPAAKP